MRIHRPLAPARRRPRPGSMLAVAATLLGTAALGPARAAPPDAFEQLMGASHIHAATGNQRLTLGVTEEGGMSLLSWPSPGYYDHLHFMSMNGPDGRQQHRRGALPSMGAYVGLAYRTSADGPIEVTWLHEEGWSHTVGYTGPRTAVVEGRFEHAELGVTLTQRDFVLPETDALLRRVGVERAESSPVEQAWLMSYANLSQNLSKVPQVPVTDFLLDHYNDFAAVHTPDDDAVVHFHPGDTGVIRAEELTPQRFLELFSNVTSPPEREFGPLGELMASSPPDAEELATIRDDLDDAYAEGVYTAVTTRPAPEQVQVGADRTDACGFLDTFLDNAAELANSPAAQGLLPGEGVLDIARCDGERSFEAVADREEWAHRPAGALEDAEDGQLEGNPLAVGQANVALRTPLAFQEGRAEATLVLAFGSTHQEARGALSAARAEPVAALQEDTASEHRSWIDALSLPDLDDEEILDFCRRALFHVRIGTDGDTGATVASISRQPFYQLDWPRDGAFLNTALDLAGAHDLVTKRMRFYADVIRDEPKEPIPALNNGINSDGVEHGWPDCPDCTAFPADSWEMNYYLDGTTGGPIRLEIDNTALLVWSYVAHAGFLPEGERTAYMEEMWPVVERATSFLAEWRDPETGLVWYANEDDHTEYTQGLQGAATVFGALDAAASMARALGHDDRADTWVARAKELRSALLEHLYVEGEGFLGKLDSETPSKGGAAAWMVWPARVLSWEDPRVRDQLRRNLTHQLKDIRGEATKGQYNTKTAISASLAFGAGTEEEAQAREIPVTLAKDIADPESLQLGEAFLNKDTNGDGEVDERVNIVSTPHLWSQSLVYLALMAHRHPERFDAWREALPPSGIRSEPAEPPEPVDGAGGGCTSAPAGVGSSVPLAVLAALGLVRRRRRP